MKAFHKTKNEREVAQIYTSCLQKRKPETLKSDYVFFKKSNVCVLTPALASALARQ